jgi:lipoyl(octanoyl) transferase
MLMANQSISKKLSYIDLGFIDYNEAWELQKNYFIKRSQNLIEDTLFLLEHPHTFTLGKVADKNNLVWDEKSLKEKNVKVYDIDRGGDITYHGPGQIVGYPILDLKLWKQDTHEYLRGLEQVIINVCSEYGIQSGRKKNYTGVWIDERKICAIGIKISRWITMHGFAFNVNTNLEMFNGIIPCGIKDKEVTSLQKELGVMINLNEVKQKIVNSFVNYFGYTKLI